MTRSSRWVLIAVIAVIVAAAGGFFIGAAKGGAGSTSVPAPSATRLPSSSPSPSVAPGPTDQSSSPTTTSTTTTRSKKDKSSSPPPTPISAPATTADTTAVTCPSPTITVDNAAALTKALALAKPGTVIKLADATYGGQFVGNISGTQDKPIWLCGGPGAVIDGGSIDSGYAFHVQDAKYWHLVGFTIRHAQKGVMVDNSTGTVIQGLTVSDIGDEAIHLRAGTTFSLVRNNSISGTGLRNKKFGEGIYIGSANSNWCDYSGCGPDRSNNNAIVGNTIRSTSAESIDIKEGTQNGLIQDNTFDGTGGLTGADSWVDVKGNAWTITGNTGKNSPVDGFQVHSVVDGWGMSNVFENNVADVNGSGYGIHLAPIEDNTVYCNNKVTGAAGGLTNTTCV